MISEKNLEDRAISLNRVVNKLRTILKRSVPKLLRNNMTYIYVMPLHETYNGYGFLENGGLPPPQNQDNDSHSNQEQQQTVKPTMNCCSKLLARCKCKRNGRAPEKVREQSFEEPGCFNCRRKLQENQINADKLEESERENKKRIWDRLKCCRSKKIGDSSCCPRQRKDSWVTKANTTSTKSISCKDKCKHFFRQIFCCLYCRKKKIEEHHISRRESVMSKKKSLTPTSVPPVDTKPKIDMSLVEHSSLMKGAIPILPVALAWICLMFNVFLPGTGTALSGMFCLCLGKPRFSQNDGPRPRIGAFLIDLIIGCGQLFTVLFCLVGWGWSIWWGVIMLKIARKHKRIRLVEERALAQVPVVNENHHSRDPERGS